MSWLKKIKHHAISSRFLDEQIYAQVLNEIENGQRRDGLWAKALAHSDGCNEKAKSLYIKYRAESIRDEITLATKDERAETPRKHTADNEKTATPESWNKNNEILEKPNTWLHILLLTIGVFLFSFIIGR
jgi:hypothetical protein